MESSDERRFPHRPSSAKPETGLLRAVAISILGHATLIAFVLISNEVSLRRTPLLPPAYVVGLASPGVASPLMSVGPLAGRVSQPAANPRPVDLPPVSPEALPPPPVRDIQAEAAAEKAAQEKLKAEAARKAAEESAKAATAKKLAEEKAETEIAAKKAAEAKANAAAAAKKAAADKAKAEAVAKKAAEEKAEAARKVAEEKAKVAAAKKAAADEAEAAAAKKVADEARKIAEAKARKEAEALALADADRRAEEWRRKNAGGGGGGLAGDRNKSSLGLAGSPDSSSGEVRGVAYTRYFNGMINHIKSNWVWTGESDHSLTTIVGFGVLPDGTISRPTIVERSGNPYYDQSVLNALRTTGRLEPPPVEHRQDFAQVEIVFRPL